MAKQILHNALGDWNVNYRIFTIISKDQNTGITIEDIKALNMSDLTGINCSYTCTLFYTTMVSLAINGVLVKISYHNHTSPGLPPPPPLKVITHPPLESPLSLLMTIIDTLQWQYPTPLQSLPNLPTVTTQPPYSHYPPYPWPSPPSSGPSPPSPGPSPTLPRDITFPVLPVSYRFLLFLLLIIFFFPSWALILHHPSLVVSHRTQ